jgi:adenylate kinase
VDAGILQKRIENRIAEAKASGQPLRTDDDPEKLKRRVEIYHEQTAPLIDYYRLEGSLKSVDGMAPIPEVASAIDRVLDGASAGRPKAAARRPTEKKAAPKKAVEKAAKTAAKKAGKKAAAKKARTSVKKATKAARKGPAKAATGSRTGKASAKGRRTARR